MAELSPRDRAAIATLARKVARLERGQRRNTRTAQAAHRSVEGGAQEVYDADGVLRSVLGEQPDGTYTRVDVNGPPPQTPAAPIVDTLPGLLIVTSYGMTEDGSDWPADFLRIDAHVGPPEFEHGPASKVAEFTRDGGSATIAVDGGDWSVVLVAVSTSGTESTPTLEAPLTVAPPTSFNGVPSYRTTDAPTGLDATDDGSLWYDTDAGDAASRWNGTSLAWVPLGDQWHKIGDPGEPPFRNNWTGTARFKKDATGLLWITLNLTIPPGGGHQTSLFQLPAAYRPPVDLEGLFVWQNATGRIAVVSVQSDGFVTWGNMGNAGGTITKGTGSGPLT